MARDVFISYHHDDQSAAEQVRADLERRNISCWMAPRDIDPGAPWAVGIESGIRRCRNFVVVLSGNTQHSRQVPRELELADKAGLKIIALRIENLEPPPGLNFFLANEQWVDAFDHHLAAALTRLSEAIVKDERYPAEKTAVHHLSPRVEEVKKAARSRLLRLAEITGVMLLTVGTATATYHRLQQVEAAERFEKAKAKVQEGDNAYSEKKFCTALKAYSEAIADDAALYQAYCMRARIYQRQGEDQKALADLSSASRLPHVGDWDHKLMLHPLPKDVNETCERTELRELANNR